MKRFHRNYCDAVLCHVLQTMCLSVYPSAVSTLYIAFLANRVEGLITATTIWSLWSQTFKAHSFLNNSDKKLQKITVLLTVLC